MSNLMMRSGATILGGEEKSPKYWLLATPATKVVLERTKAKLRLGCQLFGAKLRSAINPKTKGKDEGIDSCWRVWH
ncbi:hypothetical protein AAHA92_21528 [Salvia divinorum]|uniref:Uncharacterized protein n=1 Tax=Salvia divinorum TaxID=28513 RepID=A0ABD1GL30_SALDI